MKYSLYEYHLRKFYEGWSYEIPIDTYMGIEIIESDEWYDTKEDAEKSAKDKIDRMESGEW